MLGKLIGGCGIYTVESAAVKICELVTTSPMKAYSEGSDAIFELSVLLSDSTMQAWDRYYCVTANN